MSFTALAAAGLPTLSRRGVLAVLSGGAFASHRLAFGDDEAEARKRRNKKKRKRKNRKPKVRADVVCPGPADDGGLTIGFPNVRLGQTFVARSSGSLVKAELLIEESPGASGDYVLHLATVDAFGVPTNDVLATASVANPRVPEGQSTVTFTFARPAAVVANTQYALILFRPDSDSLFWRGHFGDTCGGRTFDSASLTAPFNARNLELDLIFTTFLRS